MGQYSSKKDDERARWSTEKKKQEEGYKATVDRRRSMDEGNKTENGLGSGVKNALCIPAQLQG